MSGRFWGSASLRFLDLMDTAPFLLTRTLASRCGKSYLTFGMYYYLNRLQGRDIRVTGLDLKADVIDRCGQLAKELHYDGLCFRQGDISDYQGGEKVDMVVSLHACDKATDYALEKAVKWGAGVILAVPCCQHELPRITMVTSGKVAGDISIVRLSCPLFMNLFTMVSAARNTRQQTVSLMMVFFI